MPKRPVGSTPYTVNYGDNLRLIAQRFHTTIYEIATMNPDIYLNPIYVGQTIYLSKDGYSKFANFNTMTENKEELKEDLRLLWEQHVAWTRFVVTSIVFGLPNLDSVSNRLLQNPIDLEDAFLPYYGNEVSSRFADLMKNHILIAAQLVKVTKAGNKDAALKAEKNWYINADEIAAFLGSINTYWSEEDWKRMLYEHLSLIKSEAVNMLNRKYTQDISTYDEIEQQALAMSDMMTNGIIKQFSNRFSY